MTDFVRKTDPPIRRKLHLPHSKFQRTVFALLQKRRRITTLLTFTVLLAAFTMSAFILLQKASWNGTSKYAVLFVYGKKDAVSRPLVIVSADGTNHTVTFLRIPPELKLDTLGGYGLYKSESLEGLAKLEKFPQSFVTQSLAVALGIDIRDVVWMNEAPSDRVPTADTARRVFFQSLFFQKQTTLHYADRIALWRFFGNVRKAQVTDIDMLSSMVHPAEGGSYTLDVLRADPIIFQLFSDMEIRKEDHAVAIVNAANEPRLGTKLARALANMGVNVTTVATAQAERDTTAILYARKDVKPAMSHTMDTVLRTVGVSQKAAKMDAERALEYRADIIVVIGKDAARVLAGSKK